MYPEVINKSCDVDHTLGIGPKGQAAKTKAVFVTQMECQTQALAKTAGKPDVFGVMEWAGGAEICAR